LYSASLPGVGLVSTTNVYFGIAFFSWNRSPVRDNSHS
jgi:hypothetical protein